MLDSIPGDNEPISWGVFPLMGDDALYVCWNGGGGIGDPLDRPPEKVTADLVAGLISKEAAGEVYGVVESKGIVDHRASEAKRKGLRQARLVVGPAQWRSASRKTCSPRTERFAAHRVRMRWRRPA
jgi:N-methylhydantoinase B